MPLPRRRSFYLKVFLLLSTSWLVISLVVNHHTKPNATDPVQGASGLLHSDDIDNYLSASENKQEDNNNNVKPYRSKHRRNQDRLAKLRDNGDDVSKTFQEIAVIPGKADAPGELGKPVTLPKNLTSDVQKLVDQGWADNAFNQYVSDMISMRRSLPDVRDPQCKDKESTYLEDLPATSVIVCFHNEAWSVLLRTVHSILDRSPAHLIKEIVLVDDFSNMEHLGRKLVDYMAKLSPKVKVIRATKREGLIRARLLGLKHATAPVVTYLDSHCECTQGWLEPLVDRIARDPTAVVCPVIDVISDKTFEYHFRGDASAINVGGFDWNLQFNWHGVPDREKKRRADTTDPVRSPTMAGGLFAISKAFFEKLGTYDSGFDIWGGENLELSFKVRDTFFLCRHYSFGFS